MPTQLVPFGIPTTLLAGVPYALPAVKATLFTDAASPTITQSNTQAFTASVAVTLVGGSATVSGEFIKAAADTVVILARD